MPISRRELLRSAPLAAIPFLPSFGTSRARASDGVPMRFFVFTTPQGTLPGRWTPEVLAGDRLELSELLMPLTPFRDKLNVISGIDNRMPRYHNSNGHNAPGHTLLCAHLCASSADSEGNLLSEGSRGEVGQQTLCMGPSIDHYLASQLGASRPINFANGGNPGENRMFYQVEPNASSQPRGERAEAGLVSDPSSIFNDYLLGLGGGEMVEPPEPSLRERLRAQRGRTLDTVRTSLARVGRTLSPSDSLILEAHADRLGAIQRRLDALGNMPTAPAMSCDPMAPMDWSSAEAQYKASLDVAVELLACGVSQVTAWQDTDYHGPSFEMLVSPISDRLSSLGAVSLPGGEVSGWHAQVHGDTGGDPHNNANLIAGYTYYSAQFAYLLQRMDSIVEANGNTLLDNSVVLWASEFGTGQSHSSSNLPIVLAGGACGNLPTGRHLSRDGSTTGDLFTSILQLFGLPDTSFGFNGDSDLNNGGISGLF